MCEQEPTPKTFLMVFIGLLVLLIITIAAAFTNPSGWLPGHGWSILIALSIAVFKALLILLYFMHVKFSPARVAAFAGAGFLWLGILFALTYSDYLTRNHPPELNFKGEPRYLQER